MEGEGTEGDDADREGCDHDGVVEYALELRPRALPWGGPGVRQGSWAPPSSYCWTTGGAGQKVRRRRSWPGALTAHELRRLSSLDELESRWQ